MTQTITLDPVTRLEGHLKVAVERDDASGKIATARSSGMLFRGFEILLLGKDPRDAIHVTQRICGVCPVAHAMASTLALEKAAGLQVVDNARLVRNLILGADFLHSHILHFYHLTLPSYLQGPAMPPWTPSYQADMRLNATQTQNLLAHTVQAFTLRRQAHEMGAILGGKLPHTNAYAFGGVTVSPTANMITRFRTDLDQIITFVDNTYQADVALLAQVYSDYHNIGAGCKNLLAFGVFDLNADGSNKLLGRGRATNGSTSVATVDPNAIVEQTRYAWYADSVGYNPSQGRTVPQSDKANAYSWLKAPRYGGVPYETGALARMWVNGDYRHGISVMDRHLARAAETSKIAHAMRDWLAQIKPASPSYAVAQVPTRATGIGLTEAPRGALGHWLRVDNGLISKYQILTPTCWNCSPRDNVGTAGPLEQALQGVPVADPTQPVEVLRVIQSFDPCLSCSVH